jgi:hypothetical protein
MHHWLVPLRLGRLAQVDIHMSLKLCLHAVCLQGLEHGRHDNPGLELIGQE